MLQMHPATELLAMRSENDALVGGSDGKKPLGQLPVGAHIRLANNLGSLTVDDNMEAALLTKLKTGPLSKLKEATICMAEGDWGNEHKEFLDRESTTDKTLHVLVY